MLDPRPSGEHQSDNARDYHSDPASNFQRGREAKFHIDQSQYECQSKEAQSNSESASVRLHEIGVGTFGQFTSSFVPSFNPTRHSLPQDDPVQTNSLYP
jgi:hypothetical protein